jgi:hypothetical protein
MKYMKYMKTFWKFSTGKNLEVSGLIIKFAYSPEKKNYAVSMSNIV